MRPVDDEDYRGRNDGLTPRQEIQMLGRLNRGEGGKRWGRDAERREKCVDVVDRVLDDAMVHPVVQLKAVELAIKMEQQNMTDERVMMEVAENQTVGQQVILVLPSNGSEIGRVEDEPGD